MAVRTYKVTPAAREARRRNAQKSTGPRTERGKRRVAENGQCAATPRPEQRVLPIPNLTGASEKLAVELAEAFEPANGAERLLVEELAQRTRCVCELRDAAGLDMSTVSKHLSLLRNAGIVEDEKRGLKVFYSLKTPCVLNFFKCVESVQKCSR